MSVLKGVKRGIIVQVAVFFAMSALLTGGLSYLAQRLLSNVDVAAQVESLGAQIAEEVAMAVGEYPAHDWLLGYWYEHADTLDVEYDVGYGSGTQTEAKYRLFSHRHPNILIKYATEPQILSMTGDDQKLYAEIAYSWLITRVDQIKKSYGCDYLFCVVTDDTFKSQFFLFSAADEGSVRGTEYEQVYPLGVVVSVAGNQSQQDAMRAAKESSSHLASAGDYVDYYAYLAEVGDGTALIGMTYNRRGLTSSADSLTWRGTLWAIALQLLLSGVCLALIYRYVLKPLRAVQKNIRFYQQTRDTAAVCGNLASVRPRNEIGELSQDVSDLAEEIDRQIERVEAITAEKERIGAELSVAARIQAAMLPDVTEPFPGRKDFDIYASMDPAKEVGGDFYDFFLLDEDHLALVIADVSGKGIPAALFMMASKIVLNNFASLPDATPAGILAAANSRITRNNPAEMFVTVWLGILDLNSGVMKCANAGHEYPCVMRKGGGFVLYKDRHGLVVGGMEGVRYRDYEIALRPGDAVFVYTDGAAEANNDREELFGTDRIVAALNADPDADCKTLIANVKKAVSAFVKDAPQFDDTTMLAVRYRGRAERED